MKALKIKTIKKQFLFLALLALTIAPLRVSAVEGCENNSEVGSNSDDTGQTSQVVAGQAEKATDAQAAAGAGSGFIGDDYSDSSANYKSSTISHSADATKLDLDPTSLNQKQLEAETAVACFQQKQKQLRSGSIDDATRSSMKSRAEHDHAAWQEISHRYNRVIQEAEEGSISAPTQQHIRSLIAASNEASEAAQELLGSLFQGEASRLGDIFAESYAAARSATDQHDQGVATQEMGVVDSQSQKTKPGLRQRIQREIEQLKEGQNQIMKISDNYSDSYVESKIAGCLRCFYDHIQDMIKQLGSLSEASEVSNCTRSVMLEGQRRTLPRYTDLQNISGTLYLIATAPNKEEILPILEELAPILTSLLQEHSDCWSNHSFFAAYKKRAYSLKRILCFDVDGEVGSSFWNPNLEEPWITTILLKHLSEGLICTQDRVIDSLDNSFITMDINGHISDCSRTLAALYAFFAKQEQLAAKYLLPQPTAAATDCVAPVLAPSSTLHVTTEMLLTQAIQLLGKINDLTETDRLAGLLNTDKIKLLMRAVDCIHKEIELQEEWDIKKRYHAAHNALLFQALGNPLSSPMTKEAVDSAINNYSPNVYYTRVSTDYGRLCLKFQGFNGFDLANDADEYANDKRVAAGSYLLK